MIVNEPANRRTGKWEKTFGKGFSLIELLVVLAIFSIVLGMAFSSVGESQKISASNTAVSFGACSR